MSSITSFRTSSDASRLPVLDSLSALSYPLIRITAGLLSATGEFFATQLGLQPGLLIALLAGLVEFFGGLALVVGLLTRPAALAVTVLMGVAIFSVHLPNGFFWTGGGYEYPLMWGLIAIAIVLRGGDRFSLDRRFGLPF
jgi:putative oxidoreductase